MILTLFVLAAPAAASDLATSLWHPAAGAMERGFAYAGTGAVASVGPGYAGTWLAATGGWGVTRRLAVSGTVLLATNATLVAAGARFNVIDGPWFRMAPVLYGATWTEAATDTHVAGAGVGLAFEGGFPRVRFDTFVPLPVPLAVAGAGATGPDDRLPGFGRFDLGVSVQIGSDHAHRLRAAVDGESVGLAYQYVGKHWFLETGSQVGVLRLSATARGGMVF